MEDILLEVFGIVFPVLLFFALPLIALHLMNIINLKGIIKECINNIDR